MSTNLTDLLLTRYTTKAFDPSRRLSAEQLQQFEEVALWAARARLGLTVHWNNEASIHHVLDAFARVRSVC